MAHSPIQGQCSPKKVDSNNTPVTTPLDDEKRIQQLASLKMDIDATSEVINGLRAEEAVVLNNLFKEPLSTRFKTHLAVIQYQLDVQRKHRNVLQAKREKACGVWNHRFARMDIPPTDLHRWQCVFCDGGLWASATYLERKQFFI